MTAAAPPETAVVPVLVADDIPTNVFVLTAILKSLGIATVTAADGAEAVEVAAARHPELIFMDVQMPRLDGIAAARRIRSEMPDRRIVIVAVTAYPEVRHQPHFRAAFDDFIIKPVDLPAVRRAVERWWAPGAGRGSASSSRA